MQTSTIQRSIVLRNAPYNHMRTYEAHGHRIYEARSAACSVSIHMQCGFTGEHGSKPGIWYGIEERSDETGQRWSRQIGNHVQDDFGTLVRVPA